MFGLHQSSCAILFARRIRSPGCGPSRILKVVLLKYLALTSWPAPHMCQGRAAVLLQA